MGLDVFFPSSCLVCGRLGVYVCGVCERLLSVVLHQTCVYCGKKSLYGLTHPRCKKKQGIDGFMTIFYYNTPFKKILKNVKYRLVADAIYDLFYLVSKYGKEQLLFYKTIEGLLISEIPLSQTKERQRGFNQSSFIAKKVSLLTEKKYKKLLYKTRETAPQAQYAHNDKQRNVNVRGSFSVLCGCGTAKTILLVDDVFTTGATVKEAVKTIKKADPDRTVFVLTLAKATTR